MGPKEGSDACVFGGAILGPLWLIFLDHIEGAGVAQPMAAGQSPAEGVCSAANTRGSAAIPAATASRGNVTPWITSASSLRPGVACGVPGAEINDQTHNRHRLELDPPDSKAMDLDHAGQRLRWAHEQPA